MSKQSKVATIKTAYRGNTDYGINPHELRIVLDRDAAFRLVDKLLKELHEEQLDTYTIFTWCTLTDYIEELDDTIPF